MISCDFYDYDGQCLNHGAFSILCETIEQGVSIAEDITGYEAIRVSNQWAVLGVEKKRLVIGFKNV